MTQNHRNSNQPTNYFLALAGLASSLAAATLLAGCAGNTPGNFGVPVPTPTGMATYTGSVYGGQQPVAGATLQLYAVGSGGYKSGSTPLIAATITTDANGNFSIPAGSYSCASATDVYLVASQGNAGSGNNPYLNLVAALGTCTSAPSDIVSINELTTVAAAYALAPFAADLTHIGSPSGASGMANAFANASNLVNFTVGHAGGASLPAGATVPTAELNTLANILASCINTNGTASQCTTLFSATGATETFGAALGIAKNPGTAAVTALASLSNSTAPFQPSLMTAPNDFSVAISYNANGALATPYGIAIDASGDAWVTNESGSTVLEMSPTGAVTFNTSADPSSVFYGSQGIAIDKNGAIWVAATAKNDIVEFTVSGGTLTSINTYGTLAGVLSGPSAIALDSGNNVWVTNFNGNSVTKFNNTGGKIGTYQGSGTNNIVSPTSIALDSSGNVYVTSGNGYAVKLSNTGVFSADYTDNAIQGPVALAVDASGDVVLTGSTTGAVVAGAVSEFNVNGVSQLAAPLSSGVINPAGIASDGTSFWVANSTASGSLAQLKLGSVTSASPAAGFGSLNTPVGVAVDGSGSVWTTNSGSNTVSQFIGLAVPVVTPLAANVGP